MTTSPVQDDKLNVSWTSMSMWNRCNYAWYLRYVRGIQTLKLSEPMSKGRIAHDMLSHHYQFMIDNEGASVDDCIQNLRQYTSEIVNTVDPMEVTLVFHCAYVIEQYIAYWQPEHEFGIYKTVATEIQIEKEMTTPSGNEFILFGIIDRMILNIKTQRLQIGEIKSHSARPWTQAEIEMDGQQLLYLKLVQEEGYEVNAVQYLFVNLYEYKNRNKVPYTKYFDTELILDKPAAVGGFLEELYAYVDEVYNARGQKPRRRISRNCGRCSLQPYCYARLKGFSHQAGLGLGFKIKDEEGLVNDDDGTT